MFDSYFVYILQSTSRRALYNGFTKCLISRIIEHRARRHPNSFTAKYRTWRLVLSERPAIAGCALLLGHENSAIRYRRWF